MIDKCKFCGAEAIPINEAPGLPIFVCKTMGGKRSRDCYEAELISKDKWRREATELFNKWLYLEKRGLLTCAVSPKILARETNVFLTIPEVVKIVREKP